MSEWRIEQGDCLVVLKDLPAESIQMVVTSPPYWGLRDYGMPGQIGLEANPATYVAALVAVFREVRCVLKDDGTCWLNLGDSYAGSGPSGASYQSKTTTRRASLNTDGLFRISKTLGERGLTYAEKKPIPPLGLKSKDLVGIPWRVAFALQADGWYLRSDIIWSKPNPMPESVTDRPTKAHEYLFLLSKKERYYYNAESIGEAITSDKIARTLNPNDSYGTNPNGKGNGELSVTAFGAPNTWRNKRSVWHIPTQPYPDAHFATFPEALVEPCIKAGSRPGDTVLDPFCGSGTTGVVACGLLRNFIGIELNPAYIALAKRRIEGAAPLFNREHSA